MSIRDRSIVSGERVLFALIVIAILVAVNVVGVRLFARADLTRNKQFSLSPASVAAVSGLKDKLTVKAYFTKNLPPPFNATERLVRDLLEEYESRSHGKMEVVIIDPSDEKLAEEARQAGITEVTHQVIEKDQAAEKKGFRGMIFSYMGDTQKIPVVADTKGLEYDITNIILLMSQERRIVGFLGGHGEPKTFDPPQDPMNPQPPTDQAALKMLRDEMKQYVVREVDLEGGKRPVPEDIEALVVVGPTQPISELEQFRLDQFVMRGGNVAFFVEGVTVNAETGVLTTTPSTVGLDGLLKHFGVRVNNDIVFDPQCDTLPVRGPFGIPLAKRYPGWPLEEIKTEHPTTFKLPALTFPWVSSIEILGEPAAGDVRVTRLAKSTPDAWRGTGEINLDPNQDWQAVMGEAKDRGAVLLAAAIEGKFKSYFAGRALPNDPEAGDLATGFLAEAAKPGRILIAGSSQMILDPVVQILQRLHGAEERSANLAFAINTVDWLTTSQALIEVRSKGVENPRLNIEKESTRNLLKYGNILAWPLLVIILGVVRWVIRSRRTSGAQRPAAAATGRETPKEEPPAEGKEGGEGAKEEEKGPEAKAPGEEVK